MRDLGDFQTPPALVAAVLGRLAPRGACWARVLEPTCGRGHFLAGLLALDPPPREVHGIELQPGHLAAARAVAAAAPGSVRVGLTEGNVFDLDLARTPGWAGDGPLLVVGNPPWVTSAALGALGSRNGPARRNLDGLAGLDAMTGGSNFDLAEAVWRKVLDELSDQRPTVAFLCKLTVARRVLAHAARAGLAVASASFAKVDARAWFGASVEAGLLTVSLGPPGSTAGGLDRVPVFDRLDAERPSAAMGLVGGTLVTDLDAYESVAFADGVCPLVWRQGLKHDAAAVMELAPGGDGGWVNLGGGPADVEHAHLYPWLKGADLARGGAPRRAVIVTQRKVGDRTESLEQTAPRLWAYLNRHAGALAARRSAVYRGAPPFAQFGVGPYSFAPYKVAVSSLHREPVFRAVGPVDGRPVMVDDTCYLLPCRTAEQAALLAALLNGPPACGLLRALASPGSKRAVTKATLQRVDLRAVLARADRDDLLARAAADVARLDARAPDWPGPLESLLEPDTDRQGD